MKNVGALIVLGGGTAIMFFIMKNARDKRLGAQARVLVAQDILDTPAPNPYNDAPAPGSGVQDYSSLLNV